MINVAQYLSLVGHNIQVLLRTIEALKEQDYPSQGPAVLAEVLVRILSRFFDELQSLAGEINERPEEDILAKAHTIHFSTVVFLPRLVEAIRSAEISSPIGGLVEAYGRICNEAQFGSQLILYPSWEYNASYREIMTVLRGITENLSLESNQGIFDGTCRYLPIITFPASEEEITLRQALIAHEVGHFIDETRQISDRLLEGPIAGEKPLQKLAEVIHDETRVTLRKVMVFISLAIDHWIREMVADSIAVCMLGPAFILAFEEFTFTTYQMSTPIEVVKSHPPSFIRLRLMSDLCQRLFFKQLENDIDEDDKIVLAQIRERLSAASSMKIPSVTRVRDLPTDSPELGNTILSVLTTSMERAIDQLEAQLDNIMDEPWSCSVEDIQKAILLRRYLEHDLTPTESLLGDLELPTFATVMNAGWFHLIENPQRYSFFSSAQNETVPDPDEVCFQFLKIQRLIAKAIESLNFQREFMRRGRGLPE